MLNLMIQKPLLGKNGTAVEVVEMSAQLRPAEKSSVSKGMRREVEVKGGVEGLNDLFLKAVDEGLKQVFKETGAQVIYSFIENKHHLKRESIAEKPEDFSACLEGLLGSAAPVIETLILKNLCSKLQLEYEEKNEYRFSDYVRELRERFGC